MESFTILNRIESSYERDIMRGVFFTQLVTINNNVARSFFYSYIQQIIKFSKVRRHDGKKWRKEIKSS